MVVLASSSRLNSMAILRLKIGDKVLLDFDDSKDHRYFQFVRNAAMFHYLVEDIPHALTSIAVIGSAARIRQLRGSAWQSRSVRLR